MPSPSAAVKPTKRTKADAAPTMTEKELQRQIMAAARDIGWKAHHQTVALYSAAGLPDLCLCKPPRLIFAELKGPKGKPTEQQREWLALLQGVPGIEVYLVYPEGLEAMYHVLLDQASAEDLERLKP